MHEFDWLNPRIIPEEFKDEFDEDLLSERIKVFKEYYDRVILYHGCRPTNISSHYEKGLLICNPQGVLDREVLAIEEHFNINISKNKILAAVKECDESIVDSKYTKNKLYTVLDDRLLRESDAGHYCLYGSESINVILDKIYHPQIGNLKSKRKEIGKPTIFKVSVPVDDIDYTELGYIVESFNDAVYNNELGWIIDCSILFTRNIDAKYIKSHSHPEESKLRDR